MASFPSITIGIPVYNEEKYIIETVNSAIKQTYKNIKIIISDNCSTDNTRELLKQFENNPNIKIILQKENIGITENFKILLEESSSDYFCWLGGHDIMLPTFIEELVEVMEINPKISLAYPLSEMIDNNSNSYNIFPNSNINTNRISIINSLKVIFNLTYCTAIHGLFRTTLLKQYKILNILGTDSAIIYYAANCGIIKSVPQILYYRREFRHESQSEKKQRYDEIGFEFIDNPNKHIIKETIRITRQNKKMKEFVKFILILSLKPLLYFKYHLNPIYIFIHRIRLGISKRLNKLF